MVENSKTIVNSAADARKWPENCQHVVFVLFLDTSHGSSGCPQTMELNLNSWVCKASAGRGHARMWCWGPNHVWQVLD